MDKKITRREFIKKTVVTTTALGVGGIVGTSKALAQKMGGGPPGQSGAPDVPLLKPEDLGPFHLAVVKGHPKNTIPYAVELLGGIKQFVKKNDKVLLKANMSFPNPHTMGTTTNPVIVREMARLCMEAGAKRVMVLDHVLRDVEICLARNGIRDACKGLDGVYVKTINERKFFKETSVYQGTVLNKIEVAKEFFNSDVLINLPIAKSHSTTGLTLGMKNMMGLIWDREYFHKVVDINKAIPDLWTVFRPALTLLDATIVLLDGGPAGPGKVQLLNTIIAGVDPVAVDAYAVSLTNWYGKRFQPKNIKHIVNAYNMGLGQINLKRLSIKRTVA
jgi:uncharacterized protein (DUF362 family)